MEELPHKYFGGKTTMVGFENYWTQLLDRLIGQKSDRQIISIVGMGGIGKTTVARNVYENSLIVQHFDVRAWIIVSQDYNVKEILLEALSHLRESANKIDKRTHEDDLGYQLYKGLSGRRYLIILDDMWSIKVWDKIKFFFPDSGNTSRIVVTTRLSNMASHLSSSPFVMNFLDEDRSWKLFCEKAFGEADYPPELVKIGKKIVEQCKGLPVSIVVIAGHLAKSSRTKEYWENIAKDINSILNSREGEQCLSMLSLSYSHLPMYLKSCFLYMGIFPEDREICASKLIKLWVAEGFVRPNKGQTLEEVAKDCLKDLADRNLILVCKWSRNGKIKTCNIHDLLREVCLKVAEKEKFLCILKLRDTPRPINGERRVAVREGYPYTDLLDEDDYDNGVLVPKSAPPVRSLICEAGLLSFDFRLLKILAVDAHEVPCESAKKGCLEALSQRVNLRYLDCRFHHSSNFLPFLCLPSSISRLQNLHTLIINRQPFEGILAPSGIWEMPKLRHVEVKPTGIYLPDPPPSDRLDQQDDLVLRNLQTLLIVENFRWSEEVCKRIPNIKKLHIRYELESRSSSGYCQHNLGRFHELESLRCDFCEEPISRDFLLNLRFPSSLKKLTIETAYFHWEDLTMFGSLPHLEVLKLCWNSIIGTEWNPVEGEFPRLTFLCIYGCRNLETWNADSSHFPVLENLALGWDSKLAIPLGIGEIPTLQRIKLNRCSMFAAISAMRILMEQEELGNQGILLEVGLQDEEERERLRKMAQEEGLRSNNLRLTTKFIL